VNRIILEDEYLTIFCILFHQNHESKDWVCFRKSDQVSSHLDLIDLKNG